MHEYAISYFLPNAAKIFDFSKGFEYEYLDKELEAIMPADEMQYLRFVDKLIGLYTPGQ